MRRAMVRLSRTLMAYIDRKLPLLAAHFFRRGYTGLNGLDRYLISRIKPISSGYYVELGANDGIRQSNTFKLQKSFGWSGLLIEPSPRQFVKCIKNRSFGVFPSFKCAACVPFGFDNKYIEIEESDLMSVAKGLHLSDVDAMAHADLGRQFLSDPRFRYQYGAMARTITSLLDEVQAPHVIDLLSLDVEGNEIAVLQGLDFSKYIVKWLLVEVRTSDEDILSYLAQKGYTIDSTLSQNSRYADLLFRRIM